MSFRRPVRELWRIVLVLGLSFSVLRTRVAADPVSLCERHATILVKALSYDERLLERAGKEVVVAVLHRAAAGEAVAEAETWHQSFAKLASLRFWGLPFRSLKLPFAGSEQLRKAIAQEGIDAIFVLGVTKDELAAIETVTREKKVLTLASDKEQVSAGLSLGVFLVDGKTTLFVNLTASREEGAVFGSEILKLANVIR